VRWLRHALAILGKDLRREARARDFAVATLVLALLMLLTFAFAFDVAGEHVRRAAPGILWATLLFSGVLVAGRTFAAEEERGTLEGLLLAPVDRGAIYLGKFLGMLVTMVALEALVLPAYAAFFGVPALAGGVLASVAAGTVGFAAAATLFGAIATHARAREVLLPLLLLPAASPLVIAGVRATDVALGGPAVGSELPWLQLIVAGGVLYLAVGLAVIDHVLE
jgi:heme exporter protein CcmB